MSKAMEKEEVRPLERALASIAGRWYAESGGGNLMTFADASGHKEDILKLSQMPEFWAAYEKYNQEQREKEAAGQEEK